MNIEVRQAHYTNKSEPEPIRPAGEPVRGHASRHLVHPFSVVSKYTCQDTPDPEIVQTRTTIYTPAGTFHRMTPYADSAPACPSRWARVQHISCMAFRNLLPPSANSCGPILRLRTPPPANATTFRAYRLRFWSWPPYRRHTRPLPGIYTPGAAPSISTTAYTSDGRLPYVALAGP